MLRIAHTLLVLWMAALAAPAQASTPLRLQPSTESVSLAGKMEIFEDRSGDLTLSEIMQPGVARRFKPVPTPRDLNLGYSSSAWWLRVTVIPESGTATRWLLEVAYPSVDRVDVHVVRNGAEISWQQAGDLQPFVDRPFPHRNLVYPIDLAAGQESTIYIRAVSEGNLTLPITLWTPDALHREDQKSYSRHALYLGALLALATYNLMLFFSLRDRRYVEYVAFALSMAVAQASLFGLSTQFLWPDLPWFANGIFPAAMSATGFFGALFTRSFLESWRTIPGLDRGIVAMIVLFFIGIFGPFTPYYQAFGIYISTIGIAFSALATIAGIVTLRRGYPGARYFLIAWTLLLVGVSLTGLRSFDVVPTNALTSHAMQIGSALEMLLLSFALADRFNLLRREKDQAQSEAMIAKELVVESLLKNEQELATRVATQTRELRDSENRLRTILDNAADGILTVDPSGRIESVNHAVETWFGYDAPELVGKPLETLFPELSSAALAERSRPALPGYRSDISEETGRQRDGTPLPVELAARQIQFADGRLHVVILHDLTERKRVENLKNEFVAIVSHELRTPLTSLRGALGLLAGNAVGPLPEKAAQLLDAANSNAERLTLLINDILDFEKIEYGGMPFDLRRHPLWPLVMQSLAGNRGFADQHDVSLAPQLPRDPEIAVVVDEDRLIQVLTNLLSNAIKFSPKKGAVEISMRRVGLRVRVEIRDHGPGVPEAFRSRIFQKFSRGEDPSGRRYAGTGLGLSLAKSMIEKMGGTIGYESVAGEGATFHIELPISV